MSELRVGATVLGSDGELGRVDAVVVDPTVPGVTHLVVAPGGLAVRRSVPVDLVEASTHDEVRLGLDTAAFEALSAFDAPDFDSPSESIAYGDLMLDPGSYFLEPYVTPADGWLLAEHERIPRGEVSVRRGDSVLSSDGTEVGRVDEFLVDPADGHVTHLVMRQGHLLRHDDDVTVPIGAATRFEEGRVVLDIDLPAVEALPKIPVHRHRGGS